MTSQKHHARTSKKNHPNHARHVQNDMSKMTR
jgi:hypothetical protein